MPEMIELTEINPDTGETDRHWISPDECRIEHEIDEMEMRLAWNEYLRARAYRMGR